MGTNCAPLLADIVPCSYEVEFIQKRIKANNKIQTLKHLISLSRYIGEVLSINNPSFAYWILLIYPRRSWDKGNNRNSFYCLISWNLPQIWHQRSTFYQTLWQNKWLQFQHYDFFYTFKIIYQPPPQVIRYAIFIQTFYICYTDIS